MEEARDWERLFIGEIKAGRDPRQPPSRSIHVSTQLGDVSAFLDAYLERCVKPAGLRRHQLGAQSDRRAEGTPRALPLSALEEPDDINRFKTDSQYAEDVELASLHRVLERLRAAINWGWRKRRARWQMSVPPLRGPTEQQKAETVATGGYRAMRRSGLLDTALQAMNTAPHQ